MFKNREDFLLHMFEGCVNGKQAVVIWKVIEAAKALRHAAWLDKCAMDLPKEEVRFIVAVDALLAVEKGTE